MRFFKALSLFLLGVGLLTLAGFTLVSSASINLPTPLVLSTTLAIFIESVGGGISIIFAFIIGNKENSKLNKEK